LSNAAPRGKRPRIAGAMLTSKPGLTGPAKRLSYWGAASVFWSAGLVERLVEAGLIERFSHPKDRRQVLVRITDKGRELVEGLKRGIVRNLQELFKDLSQEDIEAWLRIYRTIIRRSTQQLHAAKS